MFDWRLYKNDILIEEYLNIKNNRESYIVNDELLFNEKTKELTKITSQYTIIIDFNNKCLKIKCEDDSLSGSVDLLLSKINRKKHEIELIYQIEEKEDVNKVVISRRNR